MKLRRGSGKDPSGRTLEYWMLDGYVDDAATGKRKRVRQKVKGTTAETSRRAAQQRAEAQWARLVEEHATPLPQRVVGGPSELTIEQLLEWDANRSSARPRTRLGAIASGKNLLRILGREVLASSLSYFALDQYRRVRLAEGVGARTINLEVHHTLIPALNRAVEAGMLAASPIPRIAKLQERLPRIRVLTPEEKLAMLEAVRTGVEKTGKKGRGRRSIRKKDDVEEAFVVLMNTGIRPAELHGAVPHALVQEYPGFLWSDVDLKKRSLRINDLKKPGAADLGARHIALNEPTLLALTRRKERLGGAPGDPVFTFDHRLRDRVQEAARLAGIEDWKEISPYTFRHSFATALLAAGKVSIAEVAMLMGSTKEVVLKRYVHAATSGMVAALDALGDEIKESPFGVGAPPDFRPPDPEDLIPD